MTGRLIDLSFGINRKQRITLEIDSDFREQFDRLKDVLLSVEIKQHREKRSKSANAYFHVLVNKIAAEEGGSDDAIKKSLVIEYGALATDEEGRHIGFKLPFSTNVDVIYPYTKWFNSSIENGVEFNHYLVYKRTHEMDSKEMSRLIDGAIGKAKELGIETDTPEQLARYKAEWQKEERTKNNG